MKAHPGTRAHVSAILADYFKLPEPVTWADVQAFLEAEISDREGLQSIYTESAPSYVNAPPEVQRAIGHARLFADSDAHESVRTGKYSATVRGKAGRAALNAKQRRDAEDKRAMFNEALALVTSKYPKLKKSRRLELTGDLFDSKLADIHKTELPEKLKGLKVKKFARSKFAKLKGYTRQAVAETLSSDGERNSLD